MVKVDTLPKDAIIIMWRKGLGRMTKGDDAKYIVGLGDVQDATHDIGGEGGIAETAAAYLHPTRGDAKVMRLILHGDGGDGTVLDPAVVMGGVAQDHHGESGMSQHRGTLLFGIGKFFKVALVINDDEMPCTLVA